jgi:DNA primase
VAHFDLEGLKKKANLGRIVEHYLQAPVKRNGRWLWWRCPFHKGGNEKTPSFGVTPDDGRFKCYGCGAYGDVFEFVRRVENLGDSPKDFVEAAQRVAAMVSSPEMVAARPVRVRRRTDDQRAPTADWQDAARRVVGFAAKALWDERGQKARTYLMDRRGLTEETLRAWRVGYWPETRYQSAVTWALDRERDVWLPRGIVLPGEIDGAMWYVKFRPSKALKFSGKYYGIPGGKTAMLGADRWDEALDLLLCEGEMDFYTAWQALRDEVNVGTLGGASKGRHGDAVQFGRWMGTLMRFDRIWAAYDLDEAGQEAGGAMARFSERVNQVSVPYGEDVNGFHGAGGDLGTWWGIASGRQQRMEQQIEQRMGKGTNGAGGYPVTLIFQDGKGLALNAESWRELPDGRIEATFANREELLMTIEATTAIGRYPHLDLEGRRE